MPSKRQFRTPSPQQVAAAIEQTKQLSTEAKLKEDLHALWQRYHALCRIDSNGTQRLSPENYEQAKAIFAQMRELMNASKSQ
jgi:hypothetical protein